MHLCDDVCARAASVRAYEAIVSELSFDAGLPTRPGRCAQIAGLPENPQRSGIRNEMLLLLPALLPFQIIVVTTTTTSSALSIYSLTD